MVDIGHRGKDGKNGGRTVIRVPCGTLLYAIQDLEVENDDPSESIN